MISNRIFNGISGPALRNLSFLTLTAMMATSTSSVVLARSNPLIRTCTINGGFFEVYPSGTDEMALCRWNDVVVDSQTLVSSLEGSDSYAAKLILSDVVADSCRNAQANDIAIPTGETVCLFADDSKLSLAAVEAGLSNDARLHLKEVLLAR